MESDILLCATGFSHTWTRAEIHFVQTNEDALPSFYYFKFELFTSISIDVKSGLTKDFLFQAAVNNSIQWYEDFTTER